MSSELAEIHDELRAVAREILSKTSPQANRSDGASAGSSVPADWDLFANSGWLGLEAPEAVGGAEATFAEVAVLLEEMGRGATISPYLGTVVLAGGVLDALEPGAGRDELLGQIASGETVAALALPTGDETATPLAPFRLERDAGQLRLFGEAGFVPDAADAARLLVLAEHPDTGPVVVPVSPGVEGLDVAAVPVVDATRRLASVAANGVAVDNDSVWRFAGDPRQACHRIYDRGALAVACDSLGLSAGMLDATVAYAGVRQQFDRPIGSFQAVKHACADMLVATSVSRELVAAAVDAVVDGDPDAPVAVSMAKSYACGAAVDVAGKAMQLHGGIGYTWESGIHVYLKRALLDRALFGSPVAHRRRLAQRYR